jgi:hypothetical protein
MSTFTVSCSQHLGTKSHNSQHRTCNKKHQHFGTCGFNKMCCDPFPYFNTLSRKPCTNARKYTHVSTIRSNVGTCRAHLPHATANRHETRLRHGSRKVYQSHSWSRAASLGLAARLAQSPRSVGLNCTKDPPVPLDPPTRAVSQPARLLACGHLVSSASPFATPVFFTRSVASRPCWQRRC